MAEIRDTELKNLKENANHNADSTFFSTSAPFLVSDVLDRSLSASDHSVHPLRLILLVLSLNPVF